MGDPGSASMLLQIVIAGVATVLGTLAYYYRQLRDAVGRLFSRSKGDGKPN